MVLRESDREGRVGREDELCVFLSPVSADQPLGLSLAELGGRSVSRWLTFLGEMTDLITAMFTGAETVASYTILRWSIKC